MAPGAMPDSPELHLAQEPAADALLSADPFALLVGMLLDQQFPMERAFAGPQRLAERLGVQRLDPARLAAMDPEALAAVMARPPVVHRYPRAMAARIQLLAAVVVDTYGGDAAQVWHDPGTGRELLARLAGLPGFGDQKARIFLALLGKQLGVRPTGWREAAGAYGDPGSRRSVADVVDPASLAEVRAFKREQKSTAKAAGR
jgi:uncharacterized HhH-GPD family protein